MVATSSLLFEKINLQGRDQLIFSSMSPNEFIESAHTIGWKILLDIVYMANVITFRWSKFQSASTEILYTYRYVWLKLVSISQENWQSAMGQPSVETEN